MVSSIHWESCLCHCSAMYNSVFYYFHWPFLINTLGFLFEKCFLLTCYARVCACGLGVSAE